MACPCDGAGGSRAQAKGAHGRGGQGSAVAPPPHPARAFVGDDLIVDKEEEALEPASRTIAAEISHIPCSGPAFVSDLVSFMGPLPVLWEPQLAPNPCGGFTPPLPIDYRHKV